jgi:hypothetical protein
MRLGRTYGSTPAERATALPGDDLVPDPQVITDHAITIDCPPDDVWPWLVQMGWHRGGWYTARWVDRLLFPANWPSANRIIPDLQEIHLGDFISDGPPETQCGMIVEHLDPGHALALRSTPRRTSRAAGASDSERRSTGPGRSCLHRSTEVGAPASTSGHAGPQHRGGSPSAAGSSSFRPTSSCPATCCTESSSAPNLSKPTVLHTRARRVTGSGSRHARPDRLEVATGSARTSMPMSRSSPFRMQPGTRTRVRP